MNVDELSNEEHRKVLAAEAKYGGYYVHAHNVTMMLSNIMMWPTNDCDMFLRFLSQVKKHHTLSVLSTVRMHRIQAKMDMRFFLESTVHAAYSLAHTDTDIYLDHENKRIRNPQEASAVVYKWINDAFPESSKAIKGMKDGINAQTAHANVTTSAHNFALVAGERPEIHTTYFDFDEDRIVKSDLWQIGQAGLIAIDLLIGTQRIAGGFLPSREVGEQLPMLIAINDELLSELLADR